MLKKILVIFCILLFIGVASSSAINKNLIDNTEDDFIRKNDSNDSK